MPENIFREIADNAPVMIWRTDIHGRCTWFNRPWLAFVGMRLDDALEGDWSAGVHPEDLERCRAERTAAMAQRQRFQMTYRRRRAEGDWGWLLDRGAPFERDGQFAGYFGSCTDITENQHTYERLQWAYRERESLLREVYHRTKNMLQQVEGLIAIESAAIEDAAARAALSDLSKRVRAMGLVHQMLLSSGNMSRISASDFVNRLCDAIRDSSDADRRKIYFDVDAQDVEIELERAVLKGLILNELIVNALKHAFPNDRSGVIKVRFGVQDDGASFLEVADNGVGQADLEPRQDALGMILIAGLVAQLDGVKRQSGPPGTTVRIWFPRDQASETI